MTTRLPDHRQRLQKLLTDSVSQISAACMGLSAEMKSHGVGGELQKRLDALFTLIMESNRTVATESNALLDYHERQEAVFETLFQEKQRLEILYTSGIVFSSPGEVKPLMEKAIDVVVKELRADAGFIVLVNERGEPDSVYARNMNPDEHPEAKEMSTTVIRSTIATAAPVRTDTLEAQTEFARQQSVIRLGITAVLCVPLVSGAQVLGAVYLDRRNRQTPFTETDLAFLLAFARQIVQGIETSREISSLQQILISEASMKFSDLRQSFACPEIIGSSRKLFEVLRISARIAPTDAPVVLLGENGTGKDLLAQAIHRNSRRSTRPLVIINCGAIPADLLESELFGYESGAFTGATKSKPGKLELADGGTVLLDEIGELGVNLQAKLLRAIQTKEIERLGAVQPKRIDVRFIAATNRNIAEMIEAGTFREDLYYRLKVLELTMPALRERKEDIADLARFFMAKYQQGEATLTLAPDALDVLEHYSWPGNIRELENVIHRSAVLAKGSTITVADLPPELIEDAAHDPLVAIGKPLAEAETEFRRHYIIRSLRQAGSVAEAARQLGINRTHFYKLLAQLGIEY